MILKKWWNNYFHLRFANNPIRSTYYVQKANIIVCTKDSYLTRLKNVRYYSRYGIFLLNTNKNPDQVLATMNNNDKKRIFTNS